METTTTTTSYIATLEKDLVLATSAVRNLRNMMKRDKEEGYGVPPKKSKWNKPMRSEAAILRNRIDTMMGTLTIILSLCASDDSMPVQMSADDCKKALTACAVEEAATSNLEASLASYDAMAIQFVNDLCHGDDAVSWQRAAEYLQKSLALSSMLTMD